jgi:hypothetical protein
MKACNHLMATIFALIELWNLAEPLGILLNIRQFHIDSSIPTRSLLPRAPKCRSRGSWSTMLYTTWDPVETRLPTSDRYLIHVLLIHVLSYDIVAYRKIQSVSEGDPFFRLGIHPSIQGKEGINHPR